MNLEKHLHIVCLDVPYPADCKNAFVMFHEIKALHQTGVKIHLHCFEYSRPGHDILNSFCESVCYYEKQKGHKGLSFSLPYIVSSRSSELLVNNLQKDDYPILFHGIHSTFFLTHAFSKSRKLVVRLHCAEHEFYNNLVNLEKSWVNKIYYKNESRLLKRYEKNISSVATFAALTGNIEENYKRTLGCKSIVTIAAFLPWTSVTGEEGKGSFCLYHGNLAMPENEAAAVWLLENVFNKLCIPFVIAGKNPSAKIQQLAYQKAHTCLVSNPSENEMQDLISKAHINVLPSFHSQSCNIKLLNALFCGRHCVVNERMSKGTGFESLLHVADCADSFRSMISELMSQPFEAYTKNCREKLLQKQYNNSRSITHLKQVIWEKG